MRPDAPDRRPPLHHPRPQVAIGQLSSLSTKGMQFDPSFLALLASIRDALGSKQDATPYLNQLCEPPTCLLPLSTLPPACPRCTGRRRWAACQSSPCTQLAHPSWLPAGSPASSCNPTRSTPLQTCNMERTTSRKCLWGVSRQGQRVRDSACRGSELLCSCCCQSGHNQTCGDTARPRADAMPPSLYPLFACLQTQVVQASAGAATPAALSHVPARA